MRPLVLALAAVAGSALLPELAAQNPTYESPPEDLPREVAAQPLRFDHAVHSEARIQCADCHPGARDGIRAGLPDRDNCMRCHVAIATENGEVRKLAAIDPGSRIRWERVYRVPDYVFFSHAEHSRTGLECVQCHGPVATRHVLQQEMSTSMVACMNCHADRQASNECFVCHDLGQ